MTNDLIQWLKWDMRADRIVHAERRGVPLPIRKVWGVLNCASEIFICSGLQKIFKSSCIRSVAHCC